MNGQDIPPIMLEVTQQSYCQNVHENKETLHETTEAREECQGKELKTLLFI